MDTSDLQDIQDVRAAVLSEEEAAAWRRDQGYKVIEAHGRSWCETARGMYQGVHYLSRFRAAEARRPAGLCWGFRVALRPEDAAAANATWPICMLTDLADYDESCLPKTERTVLRNCRKRVRIVRLQDPALLREQGYQVYRSATSRIGKKNVALQEKYLAGLEKYVLDERRVVVAGLVGDELVGYGDWHAIDGYVYGWNIYVATEHIGTQASAGIQYESWQVFRRTGKVHTAINGMHTPELPGLMTYKRRMGFEVVHVPVRLSLPPLAGLVLRRAKPWAYYRLTGREPGVVPQ